MQKKRYAGYRSFQYLEPGDYPQVELVRELGRVPSTRVATSEAEEARVQKIFDELPVP